MRITDLLDARSILLNASPKSKNEALDQIVDLMVKSEKINDKEAYRKQVYAREKYDRNRRRNRHSAWKMRCGNKTGTGSNGS